MRKIELSDITIKGYKSIKNLEHFKPGAINVFIGANGAGKSNFISFFKFLANMVSGTGNLRFYTGLQGGASNILFDGDLDTPIIAQLSLILDLGGINVGHIIEYNFKLSHASEDTFIFNEEQFRGNPPHSLHTINWNSLGAGHKEAAIVNLPLRHKETTQSVIKESLQRFGIYQFHNTTFNSPIRNGSADINNGLYLEDDGRNLAAVLFTLEYNETNIYNKIITILTQIIPFFLDFSLNEEYGKVKLRWKERDSNKTFVATEASDGMLRAMALVTLLCLPPHRLPGVMFIDEPELGLHPAAINIICSLIQGVSEHCQVFIATQNADMLNEFDIDDIIVVNRDGRESKFNRLKRDDFNEWLDDYSLAQLWKQNIIGGRP